MKRKRRIIDKNIENLYNRPSQRRAVVRGKICGNILSPLSASPIAKEPRALLGFSYLIPNYIIAAQS